MLYAERVNLEPEHLARFERSIADGELCLVVGRCHRSVLEFLRELAERFAAKFPCALTPGGGLVFESGARFMPVVPGRIETARGYRIDWYYVQEDARLTLDDLELLRSVVAWSDRARQPSMLASGLTLEAAVSPTDVRYGEAREIKEACERSIASGEIDLEGALERALAEALQAVVRGGG